MIRKDFLEELNKSLSIYKNTELHIAMTTIARCTLTASENQQQTLKEIQTVLKMYKGNKEQIVKALGEMFQKYDKEV